MPEPGDEQLPIKNECGGYYCDENYGHIDCHHAKKYGETMDYTYSAVGVNQVRQTGEDEVTSNIVNVFGFVRAKHPEYARRWAVKQLLKNFPDAMIICAGAEPIQYDKLF